jgi:hypothetical protein
VDWDSFFPLRVVAGDISNITVSTLSSGMAGADSNEINSTWATPLNVIKQRLDEIGEDELQKLNNTLLCLVVHQSQNDIVL